MHNVLFCCIHPQPGSSTSTALLSSYMSHNDFYHTQGKWLSVLQYVAYSMGRCWEWKHQKNHCTFFWCRKGEEWINAVACNAQFRLQKAKESVVIHIPLRTHPQRYKLQMLYTGIPPWAMCMRVFSVVSQFKASFEYVVYSRLQNYYQRSCIIEGPP